MQAKTALALVAAPTLLLSSIALYKYLNQTTSSDNTTPATPLQHNYGPITNNLVHTVPVATLEQDVTTLSKSQSFACWICNENVIGNVYFADRIMDVKSKEETMNYYFFCEYCFKYGYNAASLNEQTGVSIRAHSIRDSTYESLSSEKKIALEKKRQQETCKDLIAKILEHKFQIYKSNACITLEDHYKEFCELMKPKFIPLKVSGVPQDIYFLECILVTIEQTIIGKQDVFDHLRNDMFLEMGFEEWNLQAMAFCDMVEERLQQQFAQKLKFNSKEPWKRVSNSNLGISFELPASWEIRTILSHQTGDKIFMIPPEIGISTRMPNITILQLGLATDGNMRASLFDVIRNSYFFASFTILAESKQTMQTSWGTTIDSFYVEIISEKGYASSVTHGMFAITICNNLYYIFSYVEKVPTEKFKFATLMDSAFFLKWIKTAHFQEIQKDYLIEVRGKKGFHITLPNHSFCDRFLATEFDEKTLLYGYVSMDYYPQNYALALSIDVVCHDNENEKFTVETSMFANTAKRSKIYLPHLELETEIMTFDSPSLLSNKIKNANMTLFKTYNVTVCAFVYNKKRYLVMFQCKQNFPSTKLDELLVESLRSIRIAPTTYYEQLIENPFSHDEETVQYYYNTLYNLKFPYSPIQIKNLFAHSSTANSDPIKQMFGIVGTISASIWLLETTEAITTPTQLHNLVVKELNDLFSAEIQLQFENKEEVRSLELQTNVTSIPAIQISFKALNWVPTANEVLWEAYDVAFAHPIYENKAILLQLVCDKTANKRMFEREIKKHLSLIRYVKPHASVQSMKQNMFKDATFTDIQIVSQSKPSNLAQ